MSDVLQVLGDLLLHAIFEKFPNEPHKRLLRVLLILFLAGAFAFVTWAWLR